MCNILKILKAAMQHTLQAQPSQASQAKPSQLSGVWPKLKKEVLLKCVGAAAKLLKVFSKPVGSLTQTVEDSVGTLGMCCPHLYMFLLLL